MICHATSRDNRNSDHLIAGLALANHALVRLPQEKTLNVLGSQRLTPSCTEGLPSALQGDEGARSERGEVSSSALQALWGWVDGNLLRSSHDRKYLAFQLFTLILPSVR